VSMIPDELIEQVRDAADLVELIGAAVPLKRTGSDWRGPCPFHGGTHRNFAVIPKKGMYYCYVCHEAGDVFTYLMKKQGLDYPSAVREMARRVGILIPERGGREGPDPREPLFTATAVAQEWFATRLREDGEAEPARSYLSSREIPLEAAGEHGLGYAPRGDAFRDAMRKLGLEQPVLIEAGLLHQREDGSVGARFRGRLLFPIHDLRGRVVGFSGRILGSGEPKYLNSPESPVFHKGSMLYNLHQAKQAIRKEESVLLVEGQFDVLRLVLAGVDHVVAPLGTALTPEQGALLRRFAPTVLLLYDSDAAGLRATFRAADECLRHKLRVKVATLPDGQDPDTLVRQGGAAALTPILHDAIDALDRKIQLLERKGWFTSLEHRRDALDRLLPTARATADPIARDLYLARIAEVTGVSRPVLEQELAARPEYAAPAPAPPHTRPAAPVGPGRPSNPQRRARVAGAPLEEKLLIAMLASDDWRARARTDVAPEQFQVPAYRELFQALSGAPDGTPAGSLAATLSERTREVLQRLLEQAARSRHDDFSFDEEYAGVLDGLHAREIERSLPPLEEVEARRQQVSQLSPQEQKKRDFRKAAKQPRRPAPERPGPDHSPHP
jgi:DNA primase